MAAAESFFVTRTMQALEVLAFQPCSAPQVASVLRVDPRTARRLLNRLVDEGWLVRTEGRARTYSLSLRLVAMAAHFAERSPLARAAQPAVTALHELTGGTAHLAVPSYRSTLCLVHRAGGPDARPQVRELVPAHASAAGKALLAYRHPWRESVLELPLEPLTERTLVDPVRLREECAAIEARGFAVDDGEYRPELEGVAVPVTDADGDVAAAVVLTGVRSRAVRGHLDAVRAAAADVEARLRA
jgi:DNA-binding IclR family transcriptional regulator